MQLRSSRRFGGRGRGIGLRGRIRKGRRFGVRKVLRRTPPLHPRHAKRARSASYGPSKRRKVYRDPNQYRQMETLTSKVGRKTTVATFHRKLLYASYLPTKYVFRNYKADTSGSLNLALGWEQAGGINYMPIFCINLTTIPNGGISGTSQNQACFWRLYQNPSTGVIGFQQQSGLDNTGASNAYWQQYQAFGNTGTAAPATATKKALLEWINMRYRVRGPTTKPTRVIVSVVQPYAWFQGMPEEFNLTSGAILNEHYQPWIEMASRNTKNSVQSVPHTGGKAPWKVLMSKVYELQPTSTTETDTFGHDVVQKHFWRCNRVVRYDEMPWINNDNPDATDLNIGDGNEPGAGVSCYTALGKRLYFIIQAYTPNVDAGFNAALHSSWEFMFEKKMSSLAGQVHA